MDVFILQQFIKSSQFSLFAHDCVYTSLPGAWSSVLRADELRSIMSDGDAFSGFDEPMPCFPPSYKRKKGDAEGDCGDYTDPLKIIQGFTNTGEVRYNCIIFAFRFRVSVLLLLCFSLGWVVRSVWCQHIGK